MEEYNKKNTADTDKDIVFSKSIKAGKRIYYLDVKKSRRNEMFLAITESKKVFQNGGDDTQVSFEKHKIFLYREDFERFMRGLNEVMSYIKREEERDELTDETENNDFGKEETAGDSSNIKIDIDF